MTQAPTFKPASTATPVCVLLVAMASVQIGAVLAKQLFPAVGAAGAAAMRIALASLMLLVAFRPWRLRTSARNASIIAAYGIAMGVMNLLFYSALKRIPLGIAVALEFLGPLAVAIATSRRLGDFAWIALAAVGLAALLPLGAHSKLDRVGIVFALGAGVCWALYIIFGKRAGDAHGGQTTAAGTLAAAVVIIPVGIAQAGSALLSPKIWPAALGAALFSSALPYTLEMFALMRMPTRTFGVLMSVEPALGALVGLAFLGETLSVVQWTAIGCIMIASAGIAVTSAPAPALPA